MSVRTTLPSTTNKYYLNKDYGGYSPCILGNKDHRYCRGSVLVNCVGWVVGAFNEYLNEGKCKWLGSTNAEDFIELAKKQGLQVTQEPVVGGVLVWQKGKLRNGNDGAGHVAIVAQKISNSEVITSESGWSYTTAYFTVKNRKKGSGNWGQGASYAYRGCINPPRIPALTGGTAMVELNVCKYDKKSIMRGEEVRTLQILLNAKNNAKLTLDGSYGPATETAVKTWQKKKGLAQDGVCGPATWASILK